MKKRMMGLLLLVASFSFGEAYDQIVFSENFDGYTHGKPLPQRGSWSVVQQNESKNRVALIRTDKDDVFGAGRKNQFLQVLDKATNGAVRLVAAAIPNTGSERVRLSFDAYEPMGGLDGSLGVKVGKGTVDPKKAEAVNGIKLEGGRFRPRAAGTYAMDQKFHVDIWFNESTNTVKYAATDGMEWPLEPGTMAIWVNGSGVAVNVVGDRGISALTAITSLRIETFSSSMQEVWFDNIEVAIPNSAVATTTKSLEAVVDPLLYPPVVLTRRELAADHNRIKERYIQFLVGTDQTFNGKFGVEAAAGFLDRINGPIEKAMKFDFSKDAGKTFRIFENEPGYKEEFAVYSALLQQYVLALAYGYTVNAPDSPYYQNPKVLECYLQCQAYLYRRGVREGMTFHYNETRMNMDGAPQPEGGAGNIVKMELRMGAYCQSVLLMEPYFGKTKMFKKARALVRHLEMLGKTSGHVRYYDPYVGPTGFNFLAQSDAMQNYGDTTLVSALLETDAKRQAEMLLDAKRVYTDSLKVVPGWADTIKPGFTGYHHRGIYGNAYTGGFIPQAAFGVYVLDGTHYAVDAESVENVKKLIETYRLYCQKYSMPFGIRGRMPMNTDNIQRQAFPGILIYASTLGLDDAEMKGIFKRLWDIDEVTLEFLFFGGRGKIFRGMYALDMLEQLETETVAPEPDPSGFWYKPYGGLAIHRRDNWMAAVKGYSKYIWDYENGSKLENVYGQYFSHGSLTIFAQGSPINDIDSGYNLDNGWDWYRMPGTTSVHFPIKPQKPLEHRQLSPESFLGGVSADGENGMFGMVLNQETYADGTPINLKAHKSVFFVDGFILMLGSGISGGDGKHAVETTLFQTQIPEGTIYTSDQSALVDPAGNRYYVPAGNDLKTFAGIQKSYRHNGKTPTAGKYAVAWFDHGKNPENAGYEAGIGVRGAAKPEYQIVRKNNQLHQVYFPEKNLAGYAFFQASETDDPVIKKVSDHCLIMVKEAGDELHLGVSNPDLGMVDRDFIVDYNRFINVDNNQYLPSRPQPVEVTLNGKWNPKGENDKVSIVSKTESNTVLRFDCIHGMDIRVKLVQE